MKRDEIRTDKYQKMGSEVDKPEITWFSSSYRSCGKEKAQVLDAVPKQTEFYAFGMENINVFVPIWTSGKLKYYNYKQG